MIVNFMTLGQNSVNDDPISSYIKLDQFLKKLGLTQTGGEAKHRIQNGEVKVNGITETRRGRKLITGDVVEINHDTYTVEL
jgi:ribosome-associated protein